MQTNWSFRAMLISSKCPLSRVSSLHSAPYAPTVQKQRCTQSFSVRFLKRIKWSLLEYIPLHLLGIFTLCTLCTVGAKVYKVHCSSTVHLRCKASARTARKGAYSVVQTCMCTFSVLRTKEEKQRAVHERSKTLLVLCFAFSIHGTQQSRCFCIEDAQDATYYACAKKGTWTKNGQWVKPRAINSY